MVAIAIFFRFVRRSVCCNVSINFWFFFSLLLAVNLFLCCLLFAILGYYVYALSGVRINYRLWIVCKRSWWSNWYCECFIRLSHINTQHTSWSTTISVPIGVNEKSTNFNVKSHTIRILGIAKCIRFNFIWRIRKEKKERKRRKKQRRKNNQIKCKLFASLLVTTLFALFSFSRANSFNLVNDCQRKCMRIDTTHWI